MPQNKRESLIYTVMMCFLMVLWMSMYNVAIHNGSLGLDTVREGWLGLSYRHRQRSLRFVF